MSNPCRRLLCRDGCACLTSHPKISRFCGSMVGSGDHFIDWENYSEMMVGGRYRLLFCEGHVCCLVECQITIMIDYL